MSPSTNLPPPVDTDEAPRWTIERMDRFIHALRRTRSVAAAARAAGMSRQAAYRLRERLPGHPFDQAWTAALAPREAFRRMVSGWGESGAGPVAPRDAGSRAVTQGDAG